MSGWRPPEAVGNMVRAQSGLIDSEKESYTMIRDLPKKTMELISDVMDSTMSTSWNPNFGVRQWFELLADPRFGPEVSYIMTRMFSQFPYSRTDRAGNMALTGTTLNRNILAPDRLDYHVNYKRLAKTVSAYESTEKQIICGLAPIVVSANVLPDAKIGVFSAPGTVLMRQIWRIRPERAGVDLMDLEPTAICPDLVLNLGCNPIQKQYLGELGWQPNGQPCSLAVVSIAIHTSQPKAPVGFSLTIIKPPEPLTKENIDSIFEV
jgi:hypothetical protein